MNNIPTQDTLLIVDDIPANVLVLTEFLKIAGFKVLIAKDGKRAIQRQQQLQVRTTELEQRNMQLDAFARTVAHDLKNPLNTVIGYADELTEICTEDNLLSIKKNENPKISNVFCLWNFVMRVDDVGRFSHQ